MSEVEFFCSVVLLPAAIGLFGLFLAGIITCKYLLELEHERKAREKADEAESRYRLAISERDDTQHLYSEWEKGQEPVAWISQTSLNWMKSIGEHSSSEVSGAKDAEQGRTIALYAATPPSPASQVVPREPSTGIAVIAAERWRQVAQEHWTAEHDAEHDAGELAAAGAAYAMNAADQLHPYSQGDGDNLQPVIWPWGSKWWKPKDPLRDLARAGALIAAEIDKLLAASKEPKT